MSYQRKLILFVLAIALALPAAKSSAGSSVAICGESWPPYLYESGDDNQEKKQVAGIHLENFRLLSELTGLDFTFRILPWKRCLHGVENYSQQGDFEIAIDASFNKERAEKYYLVGPLYEFGTALFYSRDRYPDGPFSKSAGRVVSKLSDMQDFSICGLSGWNYESYYEKHNIPRSVEVDQTAAGMQGVFGMVSRQRCDLVEIHPQIVIGAMVTGELKMPKDIVCRKLITDPQKFYLMVSRKSPRAKELVTRLSTALIYLKSTGKLMTIKDKGVLPAAGYSEIRKCL